MNEILRHYVPQNDIGHEPVMLSEAKHLVLRTECWLLPEPRFFIMAYNERANAA